MHGGHNQVLGRISICPDNFNRPRTWIIYSNLIAINMSLVGIYSRTIDVGSNEVSSFFDTPNND